MIINPVIPQFELGTLISNLIAVAIIIAALMTFFYLILGGLQWLTSGGDKAGIEQARSRITSAFIGLFLVMAAWVIMTLTADFFGFPFPQITIPRLGEEGIPRVSPSPKADCYTECLKSGKSPIDCYAVCPPSRGGDCYTKCLESGKSPVDCHAVCGP